MSRKNVAQSRDILPDPKFDSELIAQLINIVMRSGKKGVAERIVYGAIDEITGKTGDDPVEFVDNALDNVRPSVEVKSRRVGGATYQVPVEVRGTRRTTLAMRWIAEAARKRGEMNMPRRLAGELLDAKDERGSAVKKKEEVHRMAEANKAFSHYRW